MADVKTWVYLTDCGCTHSPNLFAELAKARNGGPADTVAVTGPVLGTGPGRIARYMTEQRNLYPPSVDGQPQALITANALVDTGASRKIGGFDDSFPSAGGEDLDFGIRLRAIGRISWSPNALVRHRFADDLAEFDARFVRYGVGMRRLSEKLGVRLEPYKFRAASPDLQDLADRQTRMMRLGYHQGSSNGAQ